MSYRLELLEEENLDARAFTVIPPQHLCFCADFWSFCLIAVRPPSRAVSGVSRGLLILGVNVTPTPWRSYFVALFSGFSRKCLLARFEILDQRRE